MFFHCPQGGKNQLFPLAFKSPWHVALHPPTSPPTTLPLGPSHSGLSTCQVYSSLRAFALLFPLLRTFQQQIFKWLPVLSSGRVLPHHCISVDYPYLSYSHHMALLNVSRQETVTFVRTMHLVCSVHHLIFSLCHCETHAYLTVVECCMNKGRISQLAQVHS